MALASVWQKLRGVLPDAPAPCSSRGRLPAAHTCFRQLDLPRYASREELRDKVVCAITTGQGYLALS